MFSPNMFKFYPTGVLNIMFRPVKISFVHVIIGCTGFFYVFGSGSILWLYIPVGATSLLD